MPINVSADETEMTVGLPPQVTIINDTAGLQIISTLPDQTIDLIADETCMIISAEAIVLEAPDINLTAEGALEVETAEMNIASGAAELEAGDLDVSAGAVEVEAGLFTVL